MKQKRHAAIWVSLSILCSMVLAWVAYEDRIEPHDAALAFPSVHAPTIDMRQLFQALSH